MRPVGEGGGQPTDKHSELFWGERESKEFVVTGPALCGSECSDLERTVIIKRDFVCFAKM